VRDDELDASWRIFTPLLHYLDDNKEIIPMEYPYGKSDQGLVVPRRRLTYF
jgi:glucose-6-phosphate 1-dehydrogenase